LARINFADADEIVHKRPTSPTTGTFVRAIDVDPRRQGQRPAANRTPEGQARRRLSGSFAAASVERRALRRISRRG